MSLTTDFLHGKIGAGFDADAMREALEGLDAQPIDPLTKGFPAGARGAAARRDRRRRTGTCWQGDLPAPVAVLRKSALEHNGRWMRHLLDTLRPASGAACQDHHDAASVGAAGGAWVLGPDRRDRAAGGGGGGVRLPQPA